MDITRDRSGGLCIKNGVSYQLAIVAERGHEQNVRLSFGMTFI